MTKHLPLIYLAVLFFTLSTACSTSRIVKPIDKGQTIVSADLGGPLITNLGAPMPVPLSSLSLSHGLRDRLTLSTGIHTTSLLYRNLQMDFSGTLELNQYNESQGWIPGLSVTPGANFLMNFRGGTSKFWPTLDFNGYYPYKEGRNFVYFGWQHFIELESLRPDGTSQEKQIRWAPHIGNTIRGDKWFFTAEAKWLAPGSSNQNLVVDYVGPANRGGLGLYFSVSRVIGKREK